MEDRGSIRRKKGNLFVVATPIGNLEDLTFRALRVMREVSALACEDTRRTLKLLTRYGVQKRLISYYQPKEGQRIPQILAFLDEGKDIALVSDSGTPGISDPGYRLFEEATLIFYLPTRRMADFIALAQEILGDREAVIARELTKVHEELLRGPLSRILQEAEARTIKGEATVLVRGRKR